MRGGIVLLLLGACAVPNLGDTPFLCGENGECPHGYACTQNVCVRDGTQLPLPPDAATPRPDSSPQNMPDAPNPQPDASRPPDAAGIPDGPRPDAVMAPDASGGGACQSSAQCGAGLCCDWFTNTCTPPGPSTYCLCAANAECTQPNECCDADFGFCLDRSTAICLP